MLEFGVLCDLAGKNQFVQITSVLVALHIVMGESRNVVPIGASQIDLLVLTCEISLHFCAFM